METFKHLGIEFERLNYSETQLQKIGEKLPAIGYFKSNITGIAKATSADVVMICRSDYGTMPIFISESVFSKIKLNQ